jgi:gliding motility-associated-like protein
MKKNHVIFFILLSIFTHNVYSQNHPGTGGTKCGSCVPAGWTLDKGSPDISDASGWGFDGSSWKKTIPPIPNGEKSWLSAHSYEVASMVISNLTVGTSYTLVFYYMSTPNNTFVGYGNFSPALRYSIDGQPRVTLTIAAEATWYKESVVFTAKATTAVFTYYGGDRDPASSPGTGELSNISFAPNGTQPTVPTCPTVKITATPSLTVCKGGTATLTATGPNTYSYTWAAGAGTGQSITITPSGSNVYQVTADSAGCKGTANSFVIVDTLPIVTVNSASICVGKSALLTASGASTYTWLPATDLSSTTGAAVTSNTTSSITYTVTGTTNACSASAVSSVIINAPPVSNAGNDITICTGTFGNIGSPATVGYTYAWSPASGLSDATVANPTITLTNATASPVVNTYTVTTTATCTSTDVVNVTVKSVDDATFNYSPSTVCKAGGTNPTPLISGTMGGTFSSSSPGLTMNASGVVDLTTTPVGTYTITYTTAGACSNASTITLAIVNVPKADFTYAGPYCKGSTNPSPTFLNGASAGVFKENTGALKFIGTAGQVNLGTSIAGTYTVINTIAAGGGCPSAADTTTIVINAAPITSVNNQTVCVGASTSLTASGADTYLWSNASTSTTLAIGFATTATYTVTGTTAGCSSAAIGKITANATPTVTVNSATICAGKFATLTASGAANYLWSTGAVTTTISNNPNITSSYTVTGTSLGCLTSAVGVITVNTSPIVTVNSVVICKGQNATLIASGAGSYLWSDATILNPKTVTTPSATTTYTVTGTAGGCTAIATATITVNNAPQIKVNSPTICIGQSAVLNASGGNSYVWSTGTSASSITVSPLTNTSYTVSDNTAGCSGSATATITVIFTPTITVNKPAVCGGKQAILMASGNAVSYSWSDGTIGKSLTVSPLTTTTYTLTGSTFGCIATITATVTTSALPIIKTADTIICEGRNALLTAKGANSYLWSTGDQNATISVIPFKTTIYTVTGYSAAGCAANKDVKVTVIPKPKADFSFSPNPAGVLNPVISFIDKSSVGVNYWSWDFGDGTTLASSTANPVHTYPATDSSYLVRLDVQNTQLCAGTVSYTVKISPDFTLYIPSAFTPNDDKINDVFGAKGAGILEFQMLLFDRWGNLIYTIDDINKTWDGKVNGKADLVQEDVYVWKVRLKDILKKEHNYIGIVTVMRGGE